MLTGGAEYELQTADSCCCGICRSLGFDNCTELREIAEPLHAALLRWSNNVTGFPTRFALLKRTDKEEGLRKGLFPRHLEAESPCVLVYGWRPQYP